MVGDLRVAISSPVVIVVAQDAIPRKLQRRVGINFFKRFLPVWIVHGLDAVLIKIIADGNDELGIDTRATFAICVAT